MNYGKKGVRAKQRALNSKSAKLGRKLLLTCVQVFLIACIGVAILVAALGIGMFKGVLTTAPNITLNALVPPGQASIIFDNEGNEIDKVVGMNSNRTIVEMDSVPKNLGHAFVAIEDERFYQHNGIDIKGMVRAGYQFIKSGGKQAQGASTITQQLIKNAIFTDWTSEGDNKIKKIKRKLQEQYLALEVTKQSNKDEVLLQYMNTINLGQNTLGIEAASQRYFGKSCTNLTLSECAVIASITQNPSKYNPIKNPTENAKRREKCLNKMLELSFISDAEYNLAIADTEAVYDRIGLSNQSFMDSNSESGTYFTDAVQYQVLDALVESGLYSKASASTMLISGGLRIYTTLDSKIQNILDEEMNNAANFPENCKWYLNYALTVTDANGNQTNYSKENMMTYFEKNIDSKFNLHFNSQDEGYEAIEIYKAAILQEGDTIDQTVSFTPQPQASITVIDQHTGYVVALIGGRGSKEGRLTLNRATDTRRPPGSTFKVLAAFAPAIDKAGLTLASVFDDKEFHDVDGRAIKNWYKDPPYRGINSIRKAIEQSMNIIASKTLTQITPQLGYDYLINFGFTTLESSVVINGKIFTDINQSLALGGITNGVTNLELCAGFATIANQGAYNKPVLFTKVLDSNGEVLIDNTNPQPKIVIKPTTAFLLTDAMVDVVTKGTGGSKVKFDGMALAGKTGTTTNSKDVWFSGYSPYYTATVWAGYDSGLGLSSGTSKVKETDLSKVLWKAVMQRIHENLPNESFPIPDGIVQQSVCYKSGKLPKPGLCDATTVVEYFAVDTTPTEECTIHYQGSICNYDHKPATAECPFPYEGILELPLIEDESLLSGSTSIIVDEAGNATHVVPETQNHCQHDATFFADPDYETKIAQQSWEISQRGIPQEQVPPTE